MTDWNLIVNVNLDDLNDEKAELLYDQLIEVSGYLLNFSYNSCAHQTLWPFIIG